MMMMSLFLSLGESFGESLGERQDGGGVDHARGRCIFYDGDGDDTKIIIL